MKNSYKTNLTEILPLVTLYNRSKMQIFSHEVVDLVYIASLLSYHFHSSTGAINQEL